MVDDRGMLDSASSTSPALDALVTERRSVGGENVETRSRLTTEAVVLPSRWRLEPARRDIFRAGAEEISLPSRPLPEPVSAVVPIAPAKPGPAFSDYHFGGRMRTPDGDELVWLRKGAATIPIRSGQQLGDGLEVVAITRDSIQLAHPESGTESALSIPKNPAEGGEW
jgi:hypothetical protein